MELKWLEDFLSLAEKASFSRAAEERHITQSALSRRIKALEVWVGSPLVDRSAYPMVLTPAGQEFRDTALSVVRQAHSCRASIRQQQNIEANTLTFAAMHTLSMTFFPLWLKAIKNEMGDLNVRVLSEMYTMENYVAALLEGVSDFLLCLAHSSVPVLIDPAKFPHLRVGAERYIPVTNVRDGKPRFSLPGDKGEEIPFLGYLPYLFSSHCVETVLRRHRVRPALKVIYQSAVAEGLREMLLETEGVAWLPQSLIRREIEAGQLTRAGDETWDLQVEIRLYRSMDNEKKQVNRLWEIVSQRHAAGH